MLILKSGNPLKRELEQLVIPVCADKEIHTDKEIVSLVSGVKKYKEFSGELSEQIILYDLPGISAKRIVFEGIGKFEKINRESFRAFAGRIVKSGIEKKITDISFLVPDMNEMKMEFKAVALPMLEGAFLANYIFDNYLEEKKRKPIEEIAFFAEEADVENYGGLAMQTEKICFGTLLARDWVSTPSNDKTPEKFVKKLLEIFDKTPVALSVISEKELEQAKFGALLAVAKGSSNAPFLVIADYNPEKAKKTIALVGKGVTFDSGGLNLKTAEGLIEMKMDMAGAASVAATLYSVASLELDIRVIGILPLVENMISGDAQRPGDIVQSYCGKSVEIGNTDAEGRLILADALSYTQALYQPDLVIDLATLTGACVMALGEKIAGVFSPDPLLAEKLVRAGDETGERCWALPMPDDYKELLKSDFADISNIASKKWGGAITAALFLSEFVTMKDWAHIDIAGPAFNTKPGDYCRSGGTGFGVRLLCEFLIHCSLP